MPRARNIKPSFFMNDTLAECEPLARILFIGLWTISDREGRLEDRPKKIKAETLPYDDCDTNVLLNQLHNRGFIIRYVVENIPYIQIVNFVKHQNCHMKENASIIPEPDLSGAKLVQELPLTESFLLNPEPFLLNPSKEKVPSTEIYKFEDFWNCYGYKIGKSKAKKAYEKAIKSGVKHESIIQGVRAYQKDCQAKGMEVKFFKHPATWLNGEHWEDEFLEGTASLSKEDEADRIKRIIEGSKKCKDTNLLLT